MAGPWEGGGQPLAGWACIAEPSLEVPLLYCLPLSWPHLAEPCLPSLWTRMFLV